MDLLAACLEISSPSSLTTLLVAPKTAAISSRSFDLAIMTLLIFCEDDPMPATDISTVDHCSIGSSPVSGYEMKFDIDAELRTAPVLCVWS